MASQEVVQPNPPVLEESEPEAEADAAVSQDVEAGEANEAEQPAADAEAAISEPVDPTTAAPEADQSNAEADDEVAEILRSDLAAQQAMAEATRQMVIVAWVAAGVTLLGVLLIARTLRYTRDAAVAATKMVTEAEAATAAATAATAEAKRQADIAERAYRRLERPYLFVEIRTQVNLANPDTGRRPVLAYSIVNHGKTPAIFKAIILELRPVSEIQFVNSRPRLIFGADRMEWYEVIPPSGGNTGPFRIEVLNSTPEQRIPTEVPLALHGRLEYEDPTGAFHSLHFLLLRQSGRFNLKFSEDHSEYPEDKE